VSISAIRSGLVTRLETISGLTVYGKPPESVRELPAALVLPISGELPQTFSGGALHTFNIKVLVSLGKGWDEAQDQLDGFLALTGSGSIAAANSNSYFGKCAQGVFGCSSGTVRIDSVYCQ